MQIKGRFSHKTEMFQTGSFGRTEINNWSAKFRLIWQILSLENLVIIVCIKKTIHCELFALRYVHIYHKIFCVFSKTYKS